MKSYKELTTAEWILINIANEAGYDKKTWEERIKLGKEVYNRYRQDSRASNNLPLLIKRLKEMDRLLSGELKELPNIYLDATASGLQIMSSLSLDLHAGEKVNIGSLTRRDVYIDTARELEEMTGVSLTRDEIKKPLMTYFYNSEAKIKKLLGEEEAEIFMDYLKTEGFKGPSTLMRIFKNIYLDNLKEVKHYGWKLPDADLYIPQLVKVTENIEFKSKELDNPIELPFTMELNQEDKDGSSWRSLMPNIIHSIDAYILREVVRRLSAKNIVVHTIHDSFQVSVNHAATLIDTYKEIFIELVESNILSKIAEDLGGAIKYKDAENRKAAMIEAIKRSEYMLS